MVRIAIVALVCALSGPAHAEEAPVVVLLPVVGKGKVVKAANRAINKLERVGGVEVAAGRGLRKLLRKNPTSAAKKCRDQPDCLAELGKRARVAHLIAATAARKGKATEVTFVLVAVESAATVHREAVEIAGASMVTEKILVALDALVQRIGQPPAVAAADGKPDETEPDETRPDEIKSDETKSDETKPHETNPDDTGEIDESKPGDGAAEEIVATPTDEDGGDTGEVPPPPPPVEQPTGWFNPSWKSYAGVGGVAGGALMIGLGAHFGNVADDLSDLHPRATQLEVVEQEKDQNAAAVASTVLITVGVTALAAGIGALVWDWFDGVPVITTGVTGGDAQAGVIWSW